ncbi:hypothetical protein CVT25_012506 [Psilocybe cyanescens]|uniref:Uncharacterized protein n=1 Tax=Psilocybe cyanescens TaxID=93625 RepID=A0A409X4D6_PSICY|nr:hypothetical protein CVT25_012506 [Psilocybe cyanescens]
MQALRSSIIMQHVTDTDLKKEKEKIFDPPPSRNRRLRPACRPLTLTLTHDPVSTKVLPLPLEPKPSCISYLSRSSPLPLAHVVVVVVLVKCSLLLVPAAPPAHRVLSPQSACVLLPTVVRRRGAVPSQDGAHCCITMSSAAARSSMSLRPMSGSPVPVVVVEDSDDGVVDNAPSTATATSDMNDHGSGIRVAGASDQISRLFGHFPLVEDDNDSVTAKDDSDHISTARATLSSAGSALQSSKSMMRSTPFD